MDADKLADDAITAVDTDNGDQPAGQPRKRTDRAPKSGAKRSRGRPKGATTGIVAERQAKKRVEQRAAAVGELLTIPAIPSMMAGSQFLAQHFAINGPLTARRLAELAEQSDELGRVLDKASEGNVLMGLVFCAMGYMGPVMLHLAGRRDQAQAASMAVQMMDNPAILQTMMATMAAEPETDDDDPRSVPPFGPPPPAQAPAS